MKQEEWIIVVAQMVTGKSKFPHTKVGAFTRYKPWPYRDSNQPHRIVYARRFIADAKDALEKGKQVDQEMFNCYVLGMGNTSTICVSEYTVILHNITTNVSQQMSSTVNDDDAKNPSFMFEGEVCSNKNLGLWRIVKGLK